jgi:hypothetical protein
MTSHPSLPLLLAALGLGALTAAAQSTDAAATSNPPGPAGASQAMGVPPPVVFTASGQVVPTPAAPPAEDEHGDRRHIQSSELTDALTSDMPKYAPPPKPTEPEASATDKPKNGVVRLPQYVVREPKSPVFTERESMTKQGLNDLAMKRYLGLDPSKMNSPLAAAITRVLFQSYASQEYADAERLSNISDLNSTAAAMARGGDTAESDYIKRASDDTYARGFESEQSGLDDHAGWGAPVPSEAATMGNAR